MRKEMRLLSPKTGRWEHYGQNNAPSVPKNGTEGALGLEKCAFRPKIRDRGSTLTGKMRLPSLKRGQREHSGQKNAPSVPKFGTEGALLQKSATWNLIFSSSSSI